MLCIVDVGVDVEVGVGVKNGIICSNKSLSLGADTLNLKEGENTF
jgi:hypothetical protein